MRACVRVRCGEGLMVQVPSYRLPREWSGQHSPTLALLPSDSGGTARGVPGIGSLASAPFQKVGCHYSSSSCGKGLLRSLLPHSASWRRSSALALGHKEELLVPESSQAGGAGCCSPSVSSSAVSGPSAQGQWRPFPLSPLPL